MDEGMGGCLTLGGDWGNLEGRKEDSSFSEEKEAKRLLHWGPRPGWEREPPTDKSLFGSFSSEKERLKP
jgi:hypothetical protein